jgi:hypothetical protein
VSAAPQSAASSAIASVIAARKSANGRKRKQLLAANGRRQIAPVQRLAPETRVFIDVTGIAVPDSHSLRQTIFANFLGKSQFSSRAGFSRPQRVTRADSLSNSADSSAKIGRVPFSGGIEMVNRRALQSRRGRIRPAGSTGGVRLPRRAAQALARPARASSVAAWLCVLSQRDSEGAGVWIPAGRASDTGRSVDFGALIQSVFRSAARREGVGVWRGVRSPRR